MKIKLVDYNQELCDEWKKVFNGCEDVEIHCADYFSIPTDCYVSPANSFGFLDGGIDNKIRKFYEGRNIDIEKTVQDYINKKFDSELLIGQSIYFPIWDYNSQKVPDIIVSPTMRVPMKLPIDSVNIYLSMRAILFQLKSIACNNRVKYISIPGLGTGIGKMPYDICAKQMKQAYDDIWLSKYKFPNTWLEAQERHQLLYGDTVRDIQYDELNLKGNPLWEKE